MVVWASMVNAFDCESNIEGIVTLIPPQIDAGSSGSRLCSYRSTGRINTDNRHQVYEQRLYHALIWTNPYSAS